MPGSCFVTGSPNHPTLALVSALLPLALLDRIVFVAAAIFVGLARALDVEDRPQTAHRLHQIRLVVDHRIKIFVGLRCFVQVLAAGLGHNALHLVRKGFQGDRAHRLAAAHHPARAVRARLKRLGVAQAAHNVRAGRHGAGDDA